jgi:SAM-dependent methyltransferase
MITKKSIIEKLGKPERKRLAADPANNNMQVNAAWMSVQQSLARWNGDEIATPKDVFEMCDWLDTDPDFNVHPDIQEVMMAARVRTGANILDDLANNALRGTGREDAEGMREINKQRDLSKYVFELILYMKQAITVAQIKGEETDGKKLQFNATRIQMMDSRLHAKLREAVLDPDTNLPKWKLVREMLPDSLKERFVVGTSRTIEKQLIEFMSDLSEVSKNLGPEALAEFYISCDPKLGREHFSRIMNIIAQYLGRGSTRFPPDKLGEIPEAFLRLPSLYNLVYIQLRTAIYLEMRDAVPVSADGDEKKFYAEYIDERARGFLDEGKEIHRQLLDDLKAYWLGKDFDADDGEVDEHLPGVLDVESPKRMVSSIKDRRTGEDCAFPSIRQQVAMFELARDRRKMTCYPQGAGKTAIPFLTFEHVGATKMLYICPNGLVDQTVEKINEYYLEGQAPSIGVIKSGIKGQELEDAMAADIVIIPYSMFGAEREVESEDPQTEADVEEKKKMKKIVEMLKELPFDFVAIDEAHRARKAGKPHTKTVYKFVNEIPNLYENGYVCEMTADPVPSTPDDIVPHLRIFDRERYKNVSTLKQALAREGVDPLVLRAAVQEFCIFLDEPHDWQKYVKNVNYDLFSEERRLYDAIVGDEHMDKSTKLRLLQLCNLNPSLFSNLPMKSSLLDESVKITNTYFDGTKDKEGNEVLAPTNVVVMVENNYNDGVTQKYSKPGYAHVPSFIEAYKAKFAEDPSVEIHVIEGKTKIKERQRIIERSKNLPEGKRMVIFAKTPVIAEGLDSLTHITRGFALQPNFSMSPIGQLLWRFSPRIGSDDFEFTILYGNGLVSEGISDHARYKWMLCDRFRRGGTLTKEEADSVSSEEGKFYAGPVLDQREWRIGSAIMQRMMTDVEKRNLMFAFLHGRGVEFYQSWIERFREEFAKIYLHKWERSNSANNGRFVAGLIQDLEENDLIKGRNFADVAAGPLVLERILGGPNADRKRNIKSFDLNPYFLEAGKESLEELRGKAYADSLKGKTAVCSMTDMTDHANDREFDVINCAYALHYTRCTPKRKHKHKDERVRTFMEFNRVLKPGGVMILTFPTKTLQPEQFKAICSQMPHFGFEVLEDYSGQGRSTDTDEDNTDHTFENFTLVCRKTDQAPDLGALDLKKLEMSRRKIHSTGTGKPQPKTKEPGEGAVHTEFKIGQVDLEFSEGFEDEMEEDRLHAENVIRSRGIIQAIYLRNGSSLLELSAADRLELSENGIALTRLHFGDELGLWTFTLEDRPLDPEEVFTA